LKQEEVAYEEQKKLVCLRRMEAARLDVEIQSAMMESFEVEGVNVGDGGCSSGAVGNGLFDSEGDGEVDEELDIFLDWGGKVG
jgi:hypothetical protein